MALVKVRLNQPKNLLSNPPRPVSLGRKSNAESRAQCEGIKGRKGDGDGDGDSELLIETIGNARDECSGNEDSRQNQGDAYNRAGDLRHGFKSGFLWRKAVFDVSFDGFDHDDGVVDDETNR